MTSTTELNCRGMMKHNIIAHSADWHWHGVILNIPICYKWSATSRPLDNGALATYMWSAHSSTRDGLDGANTCGNVDANIHLSASGWILSWDGHISLGGAYVWRVFAWLGLIVCMDEAYGIQ